MKRWLAFVVPFLLVCALGAALAAVLAWRGRACDAYVEVDFFDLDPSTRCVRVAGMAHYEVVVNQTVPGNGFFEDRHYHVFGLFPKGNTAERELRVLVRTERPPERYVTFEEMVISGRLLPMDGNKVPFETERRMSDAGGYFYGDRVFLLEPEKIEVHGEPEWVAPE